MSTIFLAFIKFVQNTFSKNIIDVQTDWGGEFRPFSSILLNFGISHRITCPYSHAQNGSVERRHRHIVETRLSLLAQSSTPSKFWAKAFQMATFLINKMSTPILKNISPFQTLFNQQLDYKFLRSFGCVCWPNFCPFNHYKMDMRFQFCVFIGYSLNHKGYNCLHIPTGRIYVSQDVHFDENRFSFSDSISPLNTSNSSSQPAACNSLYSIYLLGPFLPSLVLFPPPSSLTPHLLVIIPLHPTLLPHLWPNPLSFIQPMIVHLLQP